MNIKSSKELVEKALLEIKTLTPNEVKQLNEKNQCTLIDIRDIRELWRDGQGALHIPRGMLEFWLDPNSQYYVKTNFLKIKLILFCAAGMRSALATKTLKDIKIISLMLVVLDL